MMKALKNMVWKIKTFKIIFSLFLLTLIFLKESAAQGFWLQSNGPYGGTIHCLTVNSSNHIFAGTDDNGIFRSMDNGNTWTNVNNNDLFNTTIQALAINSSGDIFAGTMSGIYRSINNGDSWTKIFDSNTHSIAIDSASGNIYAGTLIGTYGGRIYRSTDDGHIWIEVNSGLEDIPTGSSVEALAINPAGDIFAGIYHKDGGSGVFFSPDSGDNWIEVNNDSLTNLKIRTLAINSIGDIFAGTYGGGVFRSEDNGGSWTEVNNGFTYLYIYDLAINSNDIIAGTSSGIFHSENKGDSWTEYNETGLTTKNIRAIAFNSSGNVFAGTVYCGIFCSEDIDSSWTKVNDGLTASQVWAIAVNSSDQIFSGVYGIGVFRSDDDGGSWLELNNADLYANINEIAINPAGDLFLGTTDGIYHSTDNGNTWTQINNGLQEYEDILAIIFNTNGHIFAGGSGTSGVYRSTDNGANWVEFTNGLGSTHIRAFSINSNGDIFAGTYGGGVFRSSDNGENWAAVNNGITSFHVYSIVIDSTTGNIFAGTMGGGAFLSEDNGDNWIKVNNGLPYLYIYKLAINSIGHIFAGTHEGVFRSIDNGDNWDQINEGLTRNYVKELAFNSNDYIFTGTNGGGVFPSSGSTVLPQPVLSAPENSKTGLPISNLLLNWEPTPGAASYQLHVATDLDFSTIVIQEGDITTDEKEISGLLEHNTTYFWQVRAFNATGVSRWSDCFEFKTVIAPPALFAPPDSSNLMPLDPTLIWRKSDGAESYYLQVSEDTAFTAIVLSQGDLTDTLEQITNLTLDMTYFWRVNAKNIEGTSPWSEVWTFSTFAKPTAVTDPATGISKYGATLNATVNAKGLNTEVSFKYGFTDTYGDIITAIPSTVTGSEDVQVSADLTTLPEDTLIHYRVVAHNDAGTTEGGDVTFRTLKTSGNPAAITNDASDITHVSAILNGIVNPNDLSTTVVFEYGQTLSYGNSINADQSPLNGMDNQTVSANLTNLDFNATYHYRVVATNSSGDGIGEDHVFTTASYPATVTISSTINFPFRSNPADCKPTDFRLFGIPGESHLFISDIVPGAPGDQWQAYWDIGTDDNYFKMFDNSADFECLVGRGFWLIKTESLEFNRSVNSAPLNGDEQAEIFLHPGWNIITNPFTSALNWQVVKDLNGISNPAWSFDGSFYESNIIEPYKGYYFHNNSNLSDLKIPFRASLGKSAVKDDILWQVKIMLTSGEITDACTAFGVSGQAVNGLDHFDFRKPRTVGSIPTVYFDRPQWDEDYNVFAKDIRREIKDIKVWDFEVTAPPCRLARLQFSDVNDIPTDFEVYLIDKNKAKSWNLRDNEVYDFTPAVNHSAFAVVVGKEEFVNKELISIIPKEWRLGNNFPNPFNPITTIPVEAPGSARVTLKVHNTLGEEIKTIYSGALETGRHLFKWDGRNNSGTPLPSGVYFYRLSTGKGKIFTGKMILMK